MRLASFSHRGRDSFGVVTTDGIIDIGARMYPVATLRTALTAGVLTSVREHASRLTADYGTDEITWLPTIPDAGKYLCIGVNYGNRNAEYRDRSNALPYPSVFLRTPASFVGHGQPLVRPPESKQLDYEGEIGIVIGREGRRIPLDNAADHVAGLTLINDGSVRDWLRHAKFNVTQGKNFERSGSIGPWLVTTDAIGSFDDLTLTTTVNGERRQSDTTANLIFPFARLIHYLSTFTRLLPGDVIATGTPTGAGARFDPPKYLCPGDLVEVACLPIGTLKNGVIDEQTHYQR